MELPEQDRQALIEAARRRGQGGAAFGVYPSSGKRPEKLNVSRDVNMPAQVARGWVAGTLGLPGDIEELGRLLLNVSPAGREHERSTGKSFVGETPALPTSDFYKEWLPGGDERPAAKFASGLGALAGGAGSTKLAGAALKGAKATGKALGPKAAEMAESYLKKSGLAPELIAYQGSPHKFAPEPDAPFGKFKAEKIGTGEGAQAYGYGHYTAEAPDVAESYARNLANRDMANQGRLNAHANAQRLANLAGDPKYAIDDLKFVLSNEPDHPQRKLLQDTLALLENGDFAKPLESKGYLYTVDIPDEKIAQMLDWDKPLSQQPEALKPLLKEIENVGEVAAEKIRALAQQPGVADWAKRDLLSDAAQVAKSKSPAHVAGVLKRMQLEYGISPDSGVFQEVAPEFLSFVRGMQAVPNMDTGGGAVSFLQARYGDKGASEMLRQAGIPGIKYLDQTSRTFVEPRVTKTDKGFELYWGNDPRPVDIFKSEAEAAEAARQLDTRTRNFVIFPGEEESVKIIDRKAEGGLVEDTDAIAAKLTSMDKDKALTHALRMANAKQEAHMQAGGLAKLLKGAKKAEEVAKAAKATDKAAEAAKPAVKGPQAEALEIARKNAVKMLGLPENNTAMDRARAMGFETAPSKATYHGARGEIIGQVDPAKSDFGFHTGTLEQAENRLKAFAGPREVYPEGANVMPLMKSKYANMLRVADEGSFHADALAPQLAKKGIVSKDWAKRAVKDIEGDWKKAKEYDEIVRRAMGQSDYHGIRYANEQEGQGTSYAFSDPSVLRSRFAAFDPARVNENDLLGAADPALLAGTAVASGIGLGALGQAKKRKPEQPEQKKAAGGLATLFKGSKAAKAAPAAKPAQIGNYQALPLQLPRAPNLPPQELTKTAERVARQQMGEHVRKVPNKSENLAGRSMKEVERLKNLDIQLKPTKQIPTPTVVPEKVGEVRMGLPGDISISDQILMSVNNLPIGAQQEGGALYGFGKMDLPDPAFWASNRVPAQQVQNKATDVANVFNTPDVLAMHLAMGHEAMNFAQHFADANLRAIQQMRVNPESAKLFNEIVRAGNPKTGEKFPHFPGVENYEETYKALQQDPEMRKWFNNRMKVDKITGPLGLPSGKEIEYAVMEPALSNMEPSMVGLSVGRLRPGAELIPDSAHNTYSHDIPGLALGRTQELLPVDLAFPDAAAHIRKTKRPDDFTATIQKLYPHQIVDQQYIDQVGEYYNRLRQIRGYKKGGAVKKSGLSVLNKAII